MKSGFERIGRTVTLAHAQRACLDKVRYASRNSARDGAVHVARKHPDRKGLRPYRCTICGDFHLTSKIPDSLRKAADYARRAR